MSIVVAPRSKPEIEKVNLTEACPRAFLVKHGFIANDGKLAKKHR
jgi:hypothetical protein